MTKKIKFITRLLVLTLFSTFISCNDELYDIKDQHNGIDKNKISLTQFKNETNIDQVEPILSVSTKTSIASKSKSQLSDFVIDTLAIKRHISTDNKTTYTFRIYPLSSVAQINDIYNLVYRKVNNNWETSIFYLKKLPKENNEHKLFEKIERIYGGKITNGITSKSSSLEMCSYETINFHCTNSGECSKTGVCDLCHLCVSRSITYMSCSSGGGGGGSSDPGNTSGSGGGASDPYEYSPNIFDNPVFDDPNFINASKAQSFFSHLDYAGQLWANKNATSYNQLIQYLIQKNWETSTENTINQLIALSTDNNSTFSINNSITAKDALVFNNVSQFQSMLNNIASTPADISYDTQVVGQVTANAKFQLTPFGGGVKIRILQNIGTPYTIAEVTSVSYGVSIGFTWNQTGTPAITPNKNTTTVVVDGIIAYTCLFESVGILNEIPTSYEVTINNTNGTIISARRL